MAEDDIAYLLNRGELIEPHEIKQNWKVKMAEDDIAFLLNGGELVEPPRNKTKFIVQFYAITLLLYSNKYFFFRSVINTVMMIFSCIITKLHYEFFSHILLSPVVWKVMMAEDDIAYLLNRGELIEPHEIKQNWKVKRSSLDIYNNERKKMGEF
jgi:hypothetical protein